MLKAMVVVIVILVAGLLIFAATRPDTFQVARRAAINASPEKIFPYISDLRKWGSWSPYENKDPAMKRTYSGAANGKGSVYEWDGNFEVGAGRVEITEASPPFKARIKLDMIKPIEGHNIVEFTLEPQGGVTSVTWAMQGRSSYFAKLMGIFINMDKMVGNDFEIGLANLKAVAEK